VAPLLTLAAVVAVFLFPAPFNPIESDFVQERPGDLGTRATGFSN